MGKEIVEKVKKQESTSQHVKHTEISIWTQINIYLIQNNQAVKKNSAAFKKAMVKKRCEIQGGGQEMAVMVG